MYRSLLVPLDGSSFGEHALPLALALARRCGAELHLVNVMQPLASIYSETPLFVDDTLELRLREHQRARQQTYLDGVVDRLRAAGLRTVRTAVMEGDVAGCIREQAAGVAADLVVMTTHGRGPLGRFWLGSVADTLIRHLPVPLLLTRPAEGEPDLAREPELRRLLLPLDGTPLAEQMLGPAGDLAAVMKAEVTLLRVVKPVLPLTYPVEESTLSHMARNLIDQTQRVQDQLRRDAEDYLERTAGKLRERGLEVKVRVEAEESPALAVLAHAGSHDAVALETHGRRGLSRLLLGSVADKVIRAASVPVLVHRPSAH
jgi:nucleotide-binding universal stress UspA family protein